MSRQIHIQPAADADLDEHYLYIAQGNPGAAVRFIAAADMEFRRLAQAPHLGRIRRFENPCLVGLCSWAIKGFLNYLIFYREVENGISVIRVLHGARDLERVLANERGA